MLEKNIIKNVRKYSRNKYQKLYLKKMIKYLKNIKKYN